MAMRKILVDETNRELCEHGTVGFPGFFTVVTN